MDHRRARRPFRRSPGKRLFAILLVLLVVAAADLADAFAHPADFDTLTLDLVIGTQGLESVDGAVVQSRGPGYQPFPSADLRRAVAERTLRALGVQDPLPVIDATISPRYHEVGFLVSIPTATKSGGVPLDFGTQPLQELAGGLGLTRLKLSVCGMDARAFGALSITASRPGRGSSEAGQERANCTVWDIEPPAPPVEVRVRSIKTTTGGTPYLLVASALLLIVLVACAAGRVRSRRGGRTHTVDR